VVGGWFRFFRRFGDDRKGGLFWQIGIVEGRQIGITQRLVGGLSILAIALQGRRCIIFLDGAIRKSDNKG